MIKSFFIIFHGAAFMHKFENLSLVLKVLMILSFIAVPVGAKMEEINSDRTEAAIQIDGKTNDWARLSGIFFQEQNASLAVANDQEFLFVLFRTSDMRTARIIKMSGLTLYLNIDGKKKKDFYLKFRGGPSLEQLRGRGQDQEGQTPARRPMMDESEQPFGKERAPALTCYIKDRIVEKEMPLDGSEGPMAAFDTSLGFYVYEFRVPLDSGEVRYFGLGADLSRPIAIGMEWGDMEGMRGQMGDRRGGGPGGGPGGGGGMGRGGDFGGERPQGMGGERPEMPKKQEVWVKAKLASQATK